MEKGKLLTWLVMFLLVSSLVLAIGVSPIRKVVDFEPGKEVDLQIKIRNDAEKDIRALVYARGELSDHIGLVDSLVTLEGDEKEKFARYKLILPDSFATPGVKKADLVVMEFPSSFGTEEETLVSATASVVSEVWVRVPFPGKYAEADLFIDSGENVEFVVNLNNFGKQDINSAQAIIKILGATYEEIALVETNEISISTQDQGRLVATWPPNVNPGRYHAVAEISYDEKKLIVEENFDVGQLFIGIKRIDVKDFSLGQIAVFDILLESQWNEQINNVYGELTVLGTDGTEYTRFKTASIDLPAQGQGLLKGYWDTTGVDVGKYNLRLLIHYAERVTEKLIETEVNIDSIRTQLGPTAQVVAEGGVDRDSLLTILVIVLVIINIAWMVYFMRKKKK